MKKTGEILRKTRQRKKLSLAEIAKRTKIRKDYLIALEENRYQDLPAGAYIQGFIKNYSQVLGIDSQPLLAVFRRDYQEQTGPTFRTAQLSGWQWTPKTTLIALVVLALLLFFAYLFWQYRLLLTSPYRP